MNPWEILAEDYGMGFAGRLDFSGARGGLKRDPYNRASNYPYDKTDSQYGQPQAYDRGGNKGDQLHHPLTPHDISDKDAERMGFMNDTEIDEILGYPTLLSKGDTSQQGTSVPGASGGWANNPPKDWDKDPEIDDFDDAKLERMIAKLHIRRPDLTRESPLGIDASPPDIEHIPVADPFNLLDQSDGDLEKRLANLGVGKHDLNVMAPDPWALAGARLTSRGLYGMMPKESAWDSAARRF